MLTLVIGTAIGFMAAVALVVWQWTAILKLKKVVDDLQAVQASSLVAQAKQPIPFGLMGSGEGSTTAPEDKLLKAIEALGERIAPQPAPVDPIEMLARRIHQIEQDLLAISQATGNNTNAIDQHSNRLNGQGADVDRLFRDLAGAETDHGAAIERLEKKITDATAATNRTFGQFGLALDEMTKKIIAAKRQAQSSEAPKEAV